MAAAAILNQLNGHNSAIFERLCTKFETLLENGVPQSDLPPSGRTETEWWKLGIRLRSRGHDSRLPVRVPVRRMSGAFTHCYLVAIRNLVRVAKYLECFADV